MCAIIGQFNRGGEIDRLNFLEMRDSMIHRGPDQQGQCFPQEGVGLGHCRLSIIDLSKNGVQPMSNEDARIWIVYNGETYNFQEIREELRDHRFESKTDTEVIIHAYEEWGFEKTLERLNGMFAFSIFDQKRGKVFCARDRVGIKPFVYYFDEEHFIFASEIKAILKWKGMRTGLDKGALTDYFVYRYIPNPKTIYNNILKLEPGHFLEFDVESFKLEKKEYWKLKPERIKKCSEETALEEIEQLLVDSVRARMNADTQVSTFLSGGTDSSLISAIAKEYNSRLKCFTISVDSDEKDELEYAKKAAQHINVEHHHEKIGVNECLAELENVVSSLDEPFGDTSCFPTYILSKMVAEHSKVALSGDGGDEIFFGYLWYETFSQKNLIQYIRELLDPQYSFERYQKSMTQYFSVDEVARLFRLDETPKNDYSLFSEKTGKGKIGIEDVNYLDFVTFLVDDILYKVDSMSMANSLEVRVPCLDHRLVEYLFGLDFELVYKNRQLKHLMKKIAKKYVPKDNIDREKKGFSIPIEKWMGEDLKNRLSKCELITDEIVDEKEFFRVLWEGNSEKLWLLFVFSMWYKKNKHFFRQQQ